MDNFLSTGVDKLKIRFAKEEDTTLIFDFIKELCEYEKMTDELVATEDLIHNAIFERRVAEVIFAIYENKPIGFALFFYNFSTFQGKSGIFLEDLYIRPECRGKGIGRAMLSCLARLAVERDCTRFEWRCLDWNKTGIDFYEKMGARELSEWLTFRLDGEALTKLSDEF